MSETDTKQEATSEADEEGSLVDTLIVLGRYRRSLVLWPILAAVVATALGLAWPKTYTGATKIMPPQQNQSAASAMLAQMGGLAGAAGGALGMKNPSDLFIGMLKSDTVADALIARFKLQELYDKKFLVDTRKELRGESRFVADKSGIITIETDGPSPQLAADLANAYVAELHRLTSTLAVTEAAQRRVFFEAQLKQTNEKLGDAEAKLRQAIDQGGLVSVDAQGRAAMETVARLRAQISAKEIQIGAMRAYATAGNPDMRRAEQELVAMRQELNRLESGTAPGLRPGLGTDDGGAAATGVGNIRLLREVKYNEVMFELLAKQYEMARVDESKDAPVIQVMDKAAPPEKKSKPKLRVIVPFAFVLGLVAAVVAALARHALAAARADPAKGSRLAALRAAWLRRA
jgi:uncharacterized protein involved in exopolysaccharide biosynthesis